MEHLTVPSLPIPLPRPLSDPLRRYRWLLLLVVLPSIAVGLLLPNLRRVREAVARTQATNNLEQLGLAARNYLETNGAMFNEMNGAMPPGVDRPLFYLEQKAVATDAAEDVPAIRPPSQNNSEQTRALDETVAWAVCAAALPLLLCAFFILPRRATNALYLRSFRNDAKTGSLRGVAQAALGRAFRLSGIRDPRRRWPALIRHLLYILFLIRYAQPKFMNLEAGRDWKARLWRSLGEARCALIDVTELTPFLREEIELAIRCLGFRRVLFVGDGSRTADEWRQFTLTALGLPDVPSERVWIAIWAGPAEAQASFKDQVRAFADSLPADPPGLNPAAFPETASSTDPGGNAVTGESWWTFLLANLIGVGIVGVLPWAQIRSPDASLIWLLPAVIYDTLAFFLLLQYLAVCGSLRERLRIGAIFLLAGVCAGLLALSELGPPIEGVRIAAARNAANQHLEDAALLAKSGLRLGPASEDQRPEQLAGDVIRVDAFLDTYQGTEAAQELKSWRAQADKVLEKWQAEDRKAREEPVKVPLAVLLSECRKDPAAADVKYQRKWLVVAGKVTKVTKAPINDGTSNTIVFHDLTADDRLRFSVAPAETTRIAPRADVVSLIVKLAEKRGADNALECHCTIATRADPGGVDVGKGMAAVKEGDTVTILGRWLSPVVYTGSPDGPVLHPSCGLAQCELAK
jgi:hypothetical protein